jgi:hypothetical protein
MSLLVYDALMVNVTVREKEMSQLGWVGRRIWVECFGVKYGRVIGRIDAEHVEYTLDAYPGFTYTGKLYSTVNPANERRVTEFDCI